MKSLQAFLNPREEANVKAAVSDRFLGDAGKPIEWEFRAISHEENRELNRECTRKDRKGNETFDAIKYKESLVAKSVVYPDLRSAELQKALGAYDEVEVLKALLPRLGEFAAAYQAACEANGLIAGAGDELEEVKNA